MKRTLYEVNVKNNKILVDFSTLILLKYNPFNDTLKLGFSGGLVCDIENGKILLNKITNYFNIIPLEITYE